MHLCWLGERRLEVAISTILITSFLAQYHYES
jgi:hypothetical protein